MVIKFVFDIMEIYIMSNDNIYIKFGCSLFSSCVATTIVHPFDVMKISKQIHLPMNYHFSHLYKGYFYGLTRQTTYSAPNIFLYNQLITYYKQNSIQDPSFLMKFSFGFLSGSVSGFTGNPSEVLLIKTLHDKLAKNPLQHSKEFIHSHGYKGLLNGYKIAIMRSAIYNSFRFSLYSESKCFLQHQFPSLKETSLLHFLSSGVSTLVAIVISNPVDVMKSQMQKNGNQSFTKLVKQNYQQDGMKGFYRGLVPSISKSLPHSVISFMLVEKTIKIFTGKEAL